MICICGLPGSGKTFLGKKMAAETGFVFLDDFSNIKKLFTEIDKDIDIIVAHPNLCDPDKRITFKNSIVDYNNTYDVQWIFFENDVERCLANVERRNDGRSVGPTIQIMSQKYSIPLGSDVRKIWSETERDDIEDANIEDKLDTFISKTEAHINEVDLKIYKLEEANSAYKQSINTFATQI